jgi:hypothetical protein
VGRWEAILPGIINYLGERKPHDAILIETDEERRPVYLSHLAGRQSRPVGLATFPSTCNVLLGQEKGSHSTANRFQLRPHTDVNRPTIIPDFP